MRYVVSQRHSFTVSGNFIVCIQPPSQLYTKHALSGRMGRLIGWGLSRIQPKGAVPRTRRGASWRRRRRRCGGARTAGRPAHASRSGRVTGRPSRPVTSVSARGRAVFSRSRHASGSGGGTRPGFPIGTARRPGARTAEERPVFGQRAGNDRQPATQRGSTGGDTL